MIWSLWGQFEARTEVNPGNIGHQWVKAAFIDGAEPMKVRQMVDGEGCITTAYCPRPRTRPGAIKVWTPGERGTVDRRAR